MSDDDQIDRGPFKGWTDAGVALFLLIALMVIGAALGL